jgi:hypothetical protein
MANLFASLHIRVGLSAAAVLVLTAVHHLYGAALYRTPWRAHIVHPAMAAMLFILAALYVASRYASTRAGAIARWLAVGAIVFIPIAWIGFFEGGYNHVVKDLLYFSGASAGLMEVLFPQPIYEMPDDWFFELTGVLQFFLALPLGRYTASLISERGGWAAGAVVSGRQ